MFFSGAWRLLDRIHDSSANKTSSVIKLQLVKSVGERVQVDDDLRTAADIGCSRNDRKQTHDAGPCMLSYYFADNRA